MEGLRKELQGLGSQVQERARAQIQTGPQKCKDTSGLHRELRNEEQLPWEEPEMLREEQKLLQGQLSPLAPGAAAETKDGGAALRPQLEDFRSHPQV